MGFNSGFKGLTARKTAYCMNQSEYRCQRYVSCLHMTKLWTVQLTSHSRECNRRCVTWNAEWQAVIRRTDVMSLRHDVTLLAAIF